MVIITVYVHVYLYHSSTYRCIKISFVTLINVILISLHSPEQINYGYANKLDL